MRFLLLLFLFPLVIHSLDSETNSPTYKFAVLIGEPVALNASESVKVENFDECTKKCEEDVECVMVYQANSTDPCYLFEWNSITEIKKNESGAVGTVGFKVYTDQPSCELNMQFLMNGKIYPIHANDTLNQLWKIDTSEDGWTITYIDKRDTQDLICGNFTFGRPYVDGCSPECNITMVQLSAKPEDSTNSTEQPVTSWTECMYWCHSNPDCFVAHFQDGVSTSCTWWAEGGICFLNKTEAAEGHHMAIKIPLSNTTCKLTTEQLLRNQSYPEDSPVWNMDTTDDGWVINFPSEDEENVTCGNFKYDRPYPDGCNPECMITMVQVNGVPGPISRNPHIMEASSWKECLYGCHKEVQCFMAFWTDGDQSNCTWYGADDIWFVNRTDPSLGHHAAIKLPLSNRSCKLTTEELLDDQYYLLRNRAYAEIDISFYPFMRFRTTPKYYKVQTYLDEIPQLTAMIPGCERNAIGSQNMENDWPSPTQCLRNQNSPGITAAASKEVCEEMDGHLATERFLGFFSQCRSDKTGLNYAQHQYFWFMPYMKMGWQDFRTRELKLWVGLERVPRSNQFRWKAPEWTIQQSYKANFCGTDVTFKGEVQTWAPGEPQNKPGYDCVYVLKKVLGSPFPDYQLYSAPCNTVGADGFICGFKRQQDSMIPPARSIKDEYGV